MQSGREDTLEKRYDYLTSTFKDDLAVLSGPKVAGLRR